MHVVKDGKRYRVCQSVRTPRGPRRRNLVTLGTHPDCRTVAGALKYWQSVLSVALEECRVLAEAHPYEYKHRQAWRRAAARSARARRRLKSISRFV